MIVKVTSRLTFTFSIVIANIQYNKKDRKPIVRQAVSKY